MVILIVPSNERQIVSHVVFSATGLAMTIFSSQGATLLPNVAYYNPSGRTPSLTLRRLKLILSLSLK